MYDDRLASKTNVCFLCHVKLAGFECKTAKFKGFTAVVCECCFKRNTKNIPKFNVEIIEC